MSLRLHLYAALRVCSDVNASGPVGWGHPEPLPVMCSLYYQQVLACAHRLSVLSRVPSSEDRAGDVTGQRPVVNASLRNHVPKCESDWTHPPSAWLLPRREEVGNSVPGQARDLTERMERALLTVNSSSLWGNKVICSLIPDSRRVLKYQGNLYSWKMT